MKQKLSIAMFGQRAPDDPLGGGVEVVAKELAVRMAAHGHKVTCYHRVNKTLPRSQRKKEQAGVKQRYVPTLQAKGLSAVSSSFFAALACAIGRYDVVHVHAEGPAAMCWLPKLFGKRVIVTVHGLDWQREKWSQGFGAKYIRFGERCMVRYADEIIVLSEGAKHYFKEIYKRETRFIPNGLNRPEIIPAEQITEKYGLKKDEYILFLGRLVPEKGIHYLIQAFKQVDTDKKLVIAGGSADTDEFIKKIQQMAQDDRRIIFTGLVRGQILKELYSNAYIYVLPSDLEGMPLSLLEAMSYGNCCLVSDIAECAEVVEDKAVLFKKGNELSLKQKLEELCHYPGRVEQYRKIATSFICNKYNWDNIVKDTLDIYRRMS